MINHPVHVDGSSRLAAFIPFCFFGDGLVGREMRKAIKLEKIYNFFASNWIIFFIVFKMNGK